jgi:hypothetical protein
MLKALNIHFIGLVARLFSGPGVKALYYPVTVMFGDKIADAIREAITTG